MIEFASISCQILLHTHLNYIFVFCRCIWEQTIKPARSAISFNMSGFPSLILKAVKARPSPFWLVIPLYIYLNGRLIHWSVHYLTSLALSTIFHVIYPSNLLFLLFCFQTWLQSKVSYYFHTQNHAQLTSLAVLQFQFWLWSTGLRACCPPLLMNYN